jgi:NAD(P)H dehydrogenase (quinone)
LTRSNAAHLLAHMFAILGTSGKVGRVTIAKLRAQGARVRAVVRETSGRADLEALGCEIALADLRDKDAITNAIKGASAVQVICPVIARAKDAGLEMAETIDSITAALMAVHPETVLAISDYGAQVESGIGVTMTFRYMEGRLSALPGDVIFLRSAEHMQNWARVVNPRWKPEFCQVSIIRSVRFFQRSPRLILAQLQLIYCCRSPRVQATS